MIIMFQPSEYTDHVTDDGRELKKLPYPFFMDENGFIKRQDFWRGTHTRVIGFANHPTSGCLDLWRHDYVKKADWQVAVGKYPVTTNADGQWSTHTQPISVVTVEEA